MDLISPEACGLSRERLDRIAPAFQKLIDDRVAPGFLLAVWRRGQLAYLQCLGWMDVEGRVPVQEQTLFRIYSMTKPLTAAAAMMLFEEGKLALADPVSRFIPGFTGFKVYREGGILEPALREITILDLFLHTGGLGYGLFIDSPVEDLFRQAGIDLRKQLTYPYSLDELIRRVISLPLANQPGERYRYSIGMDVLGAVVERAADQPFGDFLQERIFSPLGMVDTSFYVPPEKCSRFAALYGPDGTGHLTRLDGSSGGPFNDPGAIQAGGSGLISTLADYLRFARLFLNRGELDGARLLGRKTVEKMTRNHLPASLLPYSMDGIPHPGRGFGLGFGINLDETQSNFSASDGAYSWSGAASTHFYIDPREEIIGVLLTQVLNNPLDFDPLFRQLVSQAIVD